VRWDFEQIVVIAKPPPTIGRIGCGGLRTHRDTPLDGYYATLTSRSLFVGKANQTPTDIKHIYEIYPHFIPQRPWQGPHLAGTILPIYTVREVSTP